MSILLPVRSAEVALLHAPEPHQRFVDACQTVLDVLEADLACQRWVAPHGVLSNR